MAKIKFEEKCVLLVTVDGNSADIEFVVKLNQTLDLKTLTPGNKISLESKDYEIKNIYLQGSSPIHIKIDIETI